jgi:hypothetical protein
MKIKTRYKFLQRVSLISDETKTYVITDLTLRADKTYLYGCLDSEGQTKWYREFELQEAISADKRVGFRVIEISNKN